MPWFVNRYGNTKSANSVLHIVLMLNLQVNSYLESGLWIHMQVPVQQAGQKFLLWYDVMCISH